MLSAFENHFSRLLQTLKKIVTRDISVSDAVTEIQMFKDYIYDYSQETEKKFKKELTKCYITILTFSSLNK